MIPLINPYRFAVGSVGGWVELGRTTLGSVSDNVSVASLPNKRYYMYLFDNGYKSGNASPSVRLNSDSSSNYSRRITYNGTSDATSTNQTKIDFGLANGGADFSLGYISNLSSNENLVMEHQLNNNGNGSGNVPDRHEGVGKWANTTNPMDELTLTNIQSGDYGVDTELVVLGWDESDTHTNNFWEELASVELGSAGDILSSGTITAKKYLWVQAFTIASGNISHTVQFNNDTGSNYARRGTDNGASDSTAINQTLLVPNVGGTVGNGFTNMFIINNSANEKLVISHGVVRMSAGAGTAPSRREEVGKWVNTSSQITEIDFNNTDVGSYDTGSIIKVWGSD